jgi:hypothetical protein
MRWRTGCLTGLVVLNSTLHYLPVFVQNGVVPVEVMYLLMPTLVLCLLFTALLVFRADSKA